MRHHAKFCADRLNHWGDMAVFSILQDCGRPPSWICCTLVWITQEEYLVVFVTVQN